MEQISKDLFDARESQRANDPSLNKVKVILVHYFKLLSN